MALKPEHEQARNRAFEWLMQDPDHRAIESPTKVDAVLNLYAARAMFPEVAFVAEQFSWARVPAAIDRESLLLPLHLWIF